MDSKPAAAKLVDEVIFQPEAVATGERGGVKDALLALSQTLAREPQLAINQLAECAMRLTGADSAGISLQDTEAGAPVFRWIATSGEFARYANGTMPRDFSPCGTVLERGTTLLMHDPVRFFPYIEGLHAPVHSALLAPFQRRGKSVGTVWVVSHQAGRTFTSNDVDIVQILTTFATAILDARQSAPPA